eukprot:3298208-Rhodomonas_salina.3
MSDPLMVLHIRWQVWTWCPSDRPSPAPTRQVPALFSADRRGADRLINVSIRHVPLADERVQIETVKPFWTVLLRTLEKLAKA